MMDEETDALFRAEATALAESLEAGLLALRDRPTDRALIDGVFRDLHTIKGTGAMFGQTALAAFLHDFETTFDAVRSGRVAVTPQLVDLSLRAHDCICELLDGQPAEGRSALLAELSALTGGEAAGDDTPDDGSPGGMPEGGNDWLLRFRLPPDTLRLGGRPEIVLEELRDLGATRVAPCLDHLPPLDELDPEDLHLAWEVTLPSTLEESAIRDIFLFHEEGLELTLDRLGAPAAPAPEAAATTASPTATAPTLMRVSAERLDEMMDRVGELVIAEARLSDLAARSGDPALLAVTEDIQRLAMGMRDTTMSIRMTPLGSITGRFRRLVHDLSQALGKPLELRIAGEETELDKTVIEQLADPLMHLIRNAADHGLETGEARRAAGKPEAGAVTLSAGYSGAEVVITLADDGRGLDAEAIRAKAVERGLVSPEAELTRAEILPLIFEPGFSTADRVTELSGRGVGMDVVRRTIDGLRGNVEIASEPGEGTTIGLRLPLTLAIIDGLLVEVGNERFTIPLAAVEHIVELPEAQETGERSTRFLDIRDRLVPYLELRRLFDTHDPLTEPQKVVVVTSGETRVGLVVDRIIGSNQTVIKQLSPLHAGVRTFSGATILGDGTVALILDVPQLVSLGQALDAQEAA